VIELGLGEMNQPGLTPIVDLVMLVLLTGRERTLPEYEELFSAADLRLVNVTPARSGRAVMEAVAE
jgi:hypothetical protein